jgi:hypothetical protein
MGLGNDISTTFVSISHLGNAIVAQGCPFCRALEHVKDTGGGQTSWNKVRYLRICEI